MFFKSYLNATMCTIYRKKLHNYLTKLELLKGRSEILRDTYNCAEGKIWI